MNILITGSRGYIGSHLMAALSKVPGINVFGFDILNNTAQDIRDTVYLQRFINAKEINVVYHCAALRNVVDCSRNAIDCNHVNTDASIRLFKVCQNLGVKFIFLSTTAVKQHEASQYATSKHKAELNMEGATIVRLSNVVGMIGEEKHHARIPSLTDNLIDAFKYNRVLPLYGNVTRNFVHLYDVISSLIDALYSEGVITCTGKVNCSMTDYITKFQEYLGQNIAVCLQPAIRCDAKDLSEDTHVDNDYMRRIVESYIPYLKTA